MSKVSIIVPAYNEGVRIKKCIDSLLKQSYTNIEVIVVNDGSTDDTLEILAMYTDDRLKIISKENGGQGSARNLGIQMAEGSYLMFVDADDYVDENIVKKLLDNLENNNSDISVCDLFKETGNKKWIFNNLEFFSDDNVINLMLSHPGPVCRLYQKSLFKQNNIKFLEGVINEDLGTIPLLGIYANKVSYIDEPLYYYVIHENSTTMQTEYSKKLEDIFFVLEFLKTEFNNRCPNKYNDVLEYLYIEHLLYSASLKFVDFEDGINQIYNVINIIETEFPNWKNNIFYKKKSLKFKIVCKLIYKKHVFLVKILKKIRK